MKGGAAFARVRAFAAMLKAALATGLSLPGAIAEVGTYTSRGKGGKGRRMQRTVFSQQLQDRSKYQPHQGKRECERRMRQMARDQQRQESRA